jgi:hypothetical protein
MAALIGYIGMGQPWPLFGHDVHQVVISRTIWRAFPSLVTASKPLGDHCRRGGAGGSAMAVTISWPFHQENVGRSESHSPLVSLRDQGNATSICSDKTGTHGKSHDCRQGRFADTRCDDTMNRVPMIVSSVTTILECIACCSTARIIPAKPAEDGSLCDDRRDWKQDGRSTMLAQSKWSPDDDTDKRRAAARFGRKEAAVSFLLAVIGSACVLVWRSTTGGHASRSFRSGRQTRATLDSLYPEDCHEVILELFLLPRHWRPERDDAETQEFEDVIKEFSLRKYLGCVALAITLA